MILDNVIEDTVTVSEDLSLPLSAYVPQTQHGFILITSRSMSTAFDLIGNPNNGIEVGPMPATESSTLLSQKVGEDRNPDDVNQLVDLLGHLALAITQAAAYLNRRSPRQTMKSYITAFQKHEKQILNRDLTDLHRDLTISNPVTNTLQMSIKSIAPSALRLLSLMCLFCPDNIPDYLVSDYTAVNMTDSEVKDDDDFEDDISALKNFCLIVINNKGDSFGMHRLVQSIIKHWLESRGELESWKQKYIMVLSAAFPEDPFEDWTKCEAIFVHVEAALAYKPADHRYLPHWTTLLLKAAQYVELRGSYDQTKELNSCALEEVERMLGKRLPLSPIEHLSL